MKPAWLLFELSINVIEVFLIVYFVYSCLGSKHRKSRSVIDFIITFTAIFILLTIENLHHVLNGAEILITVVMLSIYEITCLHGTIRRKVFVAAFIMALVQFINTATVSLLSNILRIPIRQLATQDDLFRVMAILMTKICFYFASRTLVPIIRRENWQFKQNVITVFNFLIIAISGGFFLKIATWIQLNQLEQNILFIAVMGIWILGITTYFLNNQIVKQERIINEQNLLRQRQELQEIEIGRISTQYQEIKLMHHDMRNNFQCIHQLLLEGQNEKALKYAKNLCGKAQEQTATQYVHTNNTEIDALLNLKIGELKKQKTDIKCLFTGHVNQFDPVDLCAILGNLLDNAIEANEKVPFGRRKVEIQIKDFNGFLHIIIKNYILSSVLEVNPTLVTEKAERTIHGIGHYSVEDYVKKLNGIMKYYERNQMFCCSILIPVICPPNDTSCPLSIVF